MGKPVNFCAFLSSEIVVGAGGEHSNYIPGRLYRANELLPQNAPERLAQKAHTHTGFSALSVMQGLYPFPLTGLTMMLFLRTNACLLTNIAEILGF